MLSRRIVRHGFDHLKEPAALRQLVHQRLRPLELGLVAASPQPSVHAHRRRALPELDVYRQQRQMVVASPPVPAGWRARNGALPPASARAR